MLTSTAGEFSDRGNAEMRCAAMSLRGTWGLLDLRSPGRTRTGAVAIPRLKRPAALPIRRVALGLDAATLLVQIIAIVSRTRTARDQRLEADAVGLAVLLDRLLRHLLQNEVLWATR